MKIRAWNTFLWYLKFKSFYLQETLLSSWSGSTNFNHFFIKTHHRKFLNIFGQVHVILSGYSHGVRINGCAICQWTGGRVRASVNIYRAGTSSYRTPLYDRVYILFRVCKKWSAYALKKRYKRKKKLGRNLKWNSILLIICALRPLILTFLITIFSVQS